MGNITANASAHKQHFISYEISIKITDAQLLFLKHASGRGGQKSPLEVELPIFASCNQAAFVQQSGIYLELHST